MAQVLNQEYELVDIKKLKQHPRNANQGDLGAVMESVDKNGFWGAVIAQKATGYVIAGNFRLMAARELGIEALPTIWVDVDDEQALRVLVADNRTSRLGLDDNDILSDLLMQLAMTDGGLAGTGYDGDDLDAMLADLQKGDAIPKDPKPIKWDVVVKCESEEHQATVISTLVEMGLHAMKKAK